MCRNHTGCVLVFHSPFCWYQLLAFPFTVGLDHVCSCDEGHNHPAFRGTSSRKVLLSPRFVSAQLPLAIQEWKDTGRSWTRRLSHSIAQLLWLSYSSLVVLTSGLVVNFPFTPRDDGRGRVVLFSPVSMPGHTFLLQLQQTLNENSFLLPCHLGKQPKTAQPQSGTNSPAYTYSCELSWQTSE